MAQTIVSYIDDDWPNSRYSVQTNGTVIDTVTGLQWIQCSEGTSGSDCATGSAAGLNWQAALQRAQNSNFAGFTDWRLPNVEELRSIAALNRFNPSINATAFPNTLSIFYWSSSPLARFTGDVWVIDFSDGNDGDSGFRISSFRVRLVRGGQ